MKLYLGIDWDTKQLKIYFATQDTKPQKLIINEPSLEEVTQKMEALRKAFPEVEVIIAMMEAGAKQWERLLQEAGVQLHVVNPRQAKQFKESLQASKAKDDLRDAKALLALALSPIHRDNIKEWVPPSEEEMKVAILTKMSQQVLSQQTKLKQQFRSHLQTTFPMIEQILVEVDTEWVLYFFKKVPSLWKMKTLTKKRFEEIFIGSRIRTQTQEKLWLAVEKSRMPWSNKDLHAIEKMRMIGFIKSLKNLKEQRKTVDVKIEEVLSEIPIAESLCKVKGIGSVCTLLLLRYGKLNHLKHRDSLSMILGASPVFIGSGSTKKGENKGYVAMRVAVPNQAKSLTYMIGLTLTKHSRWGKAMYQYQKEKQKKTGTIFRAIARCFLRILSSMIKYGTEYDEDKYIARLIESDVPWAKGLQNVS